MKNMYLTMPNGRVQRVVKMEYEDYLRWKELWEGRGIYNSGWFLLGLLHFVIIWLMFAGACITTGLGVALQESSITSSLLLVSVVGVFSVLPSYLEHRITSNLFHARYIEQMELQKKYNFDPWQDDVIISHSGGIGNER